MHLNTETFVQNSEAATQNEHLQARLRVLSSFTLKRDAAFAELSDGEALRDRARAIKQEAIANLDLYLLQLEESITRLGGKVHWARNAEEARAIILDLARARQVKRVVKSKSMVTEEIELNEALEHAGIEAVETDLGEYIVQIADEKPSHILAPAIHKSKGDVAELFAQKLGELNLREAEEMAAVARKQLREEILHCRDGYNGR